MRIFPLHPIVALRQARKAGIGTGASQAHVGVAKGRQSGDCRPLILCRVASAGASCAFMCRTEDLQATSTPLRALRVAAHWDAVLINTRPRYSRGLVRRGADARQGRNRGDPDSPVGHRHGSFVSRARSESDAMGHVPQGCGQSLMKSKSPQRSFVRFFPLLRGEADERSLRARSFSAARPRRAGRWSADDGGFAAGGRAGGGRWAVGGGRCSWP